MEQEGSKSPMNQQGGTQEHNPDLVNRKIEEPRSKRCLIVHDLDRLLVYTKRVRKAPVLEELSMSEGGKILKKRKIQELQSLQTKIIPDSIRLVDQKAIGSCKQVPEVIRQHPSHQTLVESLNPTRLIALKSVLPLQLNSYEVTNRHSTDPPVAKTMPDVNRGELITNAKIKKGCHDQVNIKKPRKRVVYDSGSENQAEKFPFLNTYIDSISEKHLDFLSHSELVKQQTQGSQNLSSKTFVNCDVRFFNWEFFAENVGSFDVVLIDPPWRIKGAQQNDSQFMFSNCKFSLQYNTMSNSDIANIQIQRLSTNGFIFLWILNTQLGSSLEIMNKWGYQLVDQVIWVKLKNQKVFLTNGFYFMHSYEMCLIGYKRHPTLKNAAHYPIANNTLFAQVRKKSQKPDQLYSMIQMMFPAGKKIEVFARNNNLRFGWFSLGNELGDSFDKWLLTINCDRCSASIVPKIRRFKSRLKANFDLCDKCIREDEKGDFYQIENQVTQNVIHLYRSCNKCEVEPIWGNRFECKVCPNYDLCQGCFDHNLHLQERFHSVEHEMEIDQLPAFGNGFPIHDIKCSVCYQKPIVGVCFTCSICKNYNLCQKCFFVSPQDTRSKRHSKDHQMEAIFDPSLRPTPRRFQCFSCKEDILQNCWMCENCYNFFFCQKCYQGRVDFKTNMANTHKEYHRLVKIF